jgi:hypothetical protein
LGRNTQKWALVYKAPFYRVLYYDKEVCSFRKKVKAQEVFKEVACLTCWVCGKSFIPLNKRKDDKPACSEGCARKKRRIFKILQEDGTKSA